MKTNKIKKEFLRRIEDATDRATIENHYKQMTTELNPIRRELQQGLDTIVDAMKVFLFRVT